MHLIINFNEVENIAAKAFLIGHLGVGVTKNPCSSSKHIFTE